ncbi:MAG: FHA domain-containing protein [Planctomycetes bacterium]|nr:FHA domain-containing protein [Planctomycetota bacterium]
MSAKLVDMQSGLEIVLDKPVVSIGRHADNDVCVPLLRVSRYHAEVRYEDGGWVLEDHGSTYGTFVNGTHVVGTACLKDGDKIRLGSAPGSEAPHHTFSFIDGEPESSLAEQIKAGVRKVMGSGRLDAGRVVFERKGALLIARLSGVFRRKECDAFLVSLREEEGDKCSDLALDLSNVECMNSYSLAALMELGARLKEEGFTLRAVGARNTVLRLLYLAGSQSPIDICDGWDGLI